jgi:hypothetical protein
METQKRSKPNVWCPALDIDSQLEASPFTINTLAPFGGARTLRTSLTGAQK